MINQKYLFGIAIVLVLLVGAGFFLFNQTLETQEQAIPLPTLDSEREPVLLQNPRYLNGDLDAIFDDEVEPEVLDFQLKSHPNVNHIKKVGLGNQVVMWYDVNSIYQLQNALGDPEFINMKTGELVERDWRYVVWNPDNYTETYENGTEILIDNSSWNDYNSRDLLKGTQRIGIEVEVKPNDHIDGIWSVGGKQIDKHAEWQFVQKWNLDASNSAPQGVGHADGILFVADNGVHEVFVYWASNRTLIRNWSYIGDGATNVIGVGANDSSVWLGSRASNPDVFEYDHEGNFIRSFEGKGVANFPYGIGQNGTHLFLLDNTNGVVEITDFAGNSLTSWSVNASNTAPFGLAISPDGDFAYIGNRSGSVETYWANNGTFIQNFKTSSEGNELLDGVGTNGSHIFTSDNTDNQIYEWRNVDFFGSNLTIDLQSPGDNAKFTTDNINFSTNVTSSDELSIENITINVYNSSGSNIFNETNTSGIDGLYNFTNIFSNGDYDWNITAFDNESTRHDSSTRSFSVDFTAPVLSVIFPNETITFHEKNTNLNLNWSVNDSNLDSCWFNWDGTNNSLTCADNQTTFNITDGTNKNLTFYANDTFGNENSSFVTWNYRLFQNSQTFDAEVFEGLETTFSINLLTNGSDITQANLSYDGEGNLGTINNHGGDNFTVSETITAPSVSSDENKTFFWIIDQGSLSHSLDAHNQTVLNLEIDDCTVNNDTLYNFTIVDEEDQSILSGSGDDTTARLDLNIYGFATTTLIEKFNKSYSQTNPFAVCLNNNISSGGQFSHDLQVQYLADTLAEELYHVQNETINSTNFGRNVTLRDINTSTTNYQVFNIIFRDSSFIPVENALVKISRKYIDEGQFKITEIPKTDGRGEAVANLVTNDVIYNIDIIKFGTELASFDNIIPVCQIPLVQECEIDLNAFSDTIEVPDFEDAEDFQFTIDYNNNTRIIQSVFSVPSGEVSTISLNVSQQDTLGTSVCTDQLTSSSGTLSCTVPQNFGNSTITATLYKAGNFQAQGSVKLDQNPSDIFGVVLIGASLFSILTLFGAGISNNPVFTTFFIALGSILLFSTNLVANTGFIGSTATILYLFIAIIILLIKGARRN